MARVTRRNYIADDLLQKINHGDYGPGQRLPTEDELVRSYGASRNTVRGALAELARQGRIVTKHGSGSWVPVQPRPTVHLASTIDGAPDDERYTRYVQRMAQESLGDPHLDFEFEWKMSGDFPRATRLLGLGEGASDTLARRRCDRWFGTKLWERQDSYYPGEIARGSDLTSPRDIEEGTRVVLREMGYPQTRSWDVVRAKMPSPQESTDFDLEPGVPLLVQERLAYARDPERPGGPDLPIRYTETLMPANRHQLVYAEGPTTQQQLQDAMEAFAYSD
ncbi:GntR family transcriptional regulator [Streptomonospora litoralis]|uniref:Arabinose metabolism transcriptional repressor n=1 Tax=Streptomonospora litoralis TaxID=2498135 RepID=A0A4P6PW91_9ACTN|nr:GntR family transcriptional regulator [Streptomonospora litoralis]QBI52486.1 Arabinose metabolism transcriptional repressor [Streptomonospora litoralis]